jgi:hypothetical protein
MEGEAVGVAEAFTTAEAGMEGFAAATADVVGVLGAVAGVDVDVDPDGGVALIGRGPDIGVS